MLSLFRRSISVGTLLQLVLELSWVFVAGMLVLRFHDGMSFARLSVVVPALMFAIVMVMLNGAFGVYQRSVRLSEGAYALRVVPGWARVYVGAFDSDSAARTLVATLDSLNLRAALVSRVGSVF